MDFQLSASAFEAEARPAASDEIASLGACAVVNFAMALLRVSAIAILASPLLVAWFVGRAWL